MRIRARGLMWHVVEVDSAADRQRLSLRCAEGDMVGLTWELYVPPEQIELVNEVLDPECPAPLSLWRLMHQARALNELPGEMTFVARQPGRIRVEPYQLVPLMRALDMPRPRLLLADGVGLGKTIQAIIIAAEFIARRRAHRILIVTPSGPLLSQWEQETRLRFGLKFTPISNAAELWDIRRANELGSNPFDSVSLCITSLDFAKQDHVLEELGRCAWDLVIIDEAHHCVGFGPRVSQEATYRRRLAEVLARRSDGLLLLTATPHDGQDAHFASLIALLDPSLVDGAGGFLGRDYRHHVIRRMKTHIRDPHTGVPLFRERHVVHVKVDVGGTEHEAVRDFHRALSAFVVPRIRRRPGTDDTLAFVSLLKRSVSTITACLETLRVVIERLARLASGDVETKAAQHERARALRAWRRRAARFGTLGAEDEASRDALEVQSMAEALRVEPDNEMARLIQLGVAAEPDDPKLSAVILEVQLIRLAHPRANILVYTEYTDSQVAAARALRAARGIEGDFLSIGGQDDDQARADAAERFAAIDGQILISTDSLAEGLNLHSRCFHLIHLDLPYNPNRLEQRNGRIDRYGQSHRPEIRYLYIPGTFEESLLLHLIAKYEKARSALEVMPDTLGVTATPDDYDGPLMGNLSERPEDLFETGANPIHTLDRAVADSSPETVSELMREIDRAFGAFDLMAVAHGWYGARGLNAGINQIIQAEQFRSTSPHAGGLVDFVRAVIVAETGESSIVPDELGLPETWVHGLDGLPGFDSGTRVMRFTRDMETWRDPGGRGTEYVGRVHPLALRAIRRGSQLPGAVAFGYGSQLSLLLTYEIEIAVAHNIVFREIIAVLAGPVLPPTEVTHWIDFADYRDVGPIDKVWERWFAPWENRARRDAEHLSHGIGLKKHEAFIARYEGVRQETLARSRHWLRARADLLCGPFVPQTGDLFGASDLAPIWGRQEDPSTRLVSLATCPNVLGSKRREASEALETFREMAPSEEMPGPFVCHPIGMLMVVPRNAS